MFEEKKFFIKLFLFIPFYSDTFEGNIGKIQKGCLVHVLMYEQKTCMTFCIYHSKKICICQQSTFLFFFIFSPHSCIFVFLALSLGKVQNNIKLKPQDLSTQVVSLLQKGAGVLIQHPQKRKCQGGLGNFYTLLH